MAVPNMLLAVMFVAIVTLPELHAQGQCPDFKIRPKEATNVEVGNNLAKIFVDILFSEDKVGSLTSGGSDYFRDSSLLFVPAILFLVVMFLGCCPIWIIFNCCENCWYKKRKVYKNFIPWVFFGIWALLYVIYIIVSTSTLINFTEMTGGMVQFVCDVGGSILEIVKWFKGIVDIALNLGAQLGATISESNKTIFRTLDKLESDVNGLKQNVDGVVSTIAVASSTITAALKDADLASKDVQLPATDLEQIVNAAFGPTGIPSIITGARTSTSDVIGSVKDLVQSFPDALNDTMSSAQHSFQQIRQDAFDDADIELYVPGLIASEKVDMQGAVLKLMNAIMMVVNLITIPAMAYFPFLLAGGIIIAVAFKFCFPSERWACVGRCMSKCGGVMLWLGVMLLLVYNIVFLVVYVMYDDLCAIAVDPNLLVSYAREAYPTEINKSLAQFIPAPPENTGDSSPEIFSLDAANILDSVSICMAGSSYSGDKTLAQTLGFKESSVKKILDDELAKVKNSALDLSGVESEMQGASNDIQKNKGKLAQYKFPTSLLNAASASCSSCTNFTAFWDEYEQLTGNPDSAYYEQDQQQRENLKKYGKVCDEMCTESPAENCDGYDPSSTTNTQATVSGTNIQVNGQTFAAPTQLLQAVLDGDDGEDLCAECRDRVCNASAVLTTVNGQIGKIDTALDTLKSSLKAKMDGIAPMVDSLIDDVSAVLHKGVTDLGDTSNKLKCGVIGDLYYTLLYSPCNSVLEAYWRFSMSFFMRGMFGLLLVVATILLNLYVGLREYKDKSNKVLPKDQQKTHVQVAETVTIDGDGTAVPKPQSTTDTSVEMVATENSEKSPTSENHKEADTTPVVTEKEAKVDTAVANEKEAKADTAVANEQEAKADTAVANEQEAKADTAVANEKEATADTAVANEQEATAGEASDTIKITTVTDL